MKKKPDGYWINSFDHCYEAAKEYHSRSEFQKGNSGAYEASKKRGWIDLFDWLTGIPQSMKEAHNDYVYVYIFEDYKTAYVGRTINLRETIRRHRSPSYNDVVYRFAKEHHIIVPEIHILEKEITISEGKEKEDYWRRYYYDKGYNILNKAKTGKFSGSVGNLVSVFDQELCYKLAKECSTITEYSIKYSRAYQISLDNSWISNYFWFEEKQKPKKYWNKEHCFEAADHCNSIVEFQRLYPSAYSVARKNKWLDVLFTRQLKPHGYWNNKEICYAEANKYKKISQFKRGTPAAYKAAKDNGWLDEWFDRKKVPNGYWNNKEICHAECTKYKTISQFMRGTPAAYDAALANGWLDEWFKRERVKRGSWTEEECAQIAKKYKNKRDFQKFDNAAYIAARRGGWLNKFEWLNSLRKPSGYWTKDKCFEIAKECSSRIDFEKRNASACSISRANGWLDEWFPKDK